MSVVPTTNPLYSNFNHTNTAFTIAQNGIFLKITFAAPLSVSYQLNEKLFNIKYSDLGANYVDLGEFDWGILTVNYALCTSPVAGSRQAWIDAVVALITNGSGSSYIPTLGAGSATDHLVGYNTTTGQLTDLGTIQQQWVHVYSTVSVAVPNGAGAAAAVSYNVEVSDPLNLWNTNTFTTPATGIYLFSYSYQAAGAFQVTLYLRVNGVQQNITIPFGAVTASTTLSLTAGDTVQLVHYAAGAGDTTVVAPAGIFNLKAKRII
jgi:hypothetical protein